MRSATILARVCLLSLSLCAGCGEESTPAAPGGTGGTGGSAGGTGGTGGEAGAGGSEPVTITVFHTTDEHGHVQPDDLREPGVIWGGAANLRAWITQAGYDPDEHLLLSSGDNWTGPAISTWFQGESTVEVFNTMGYDASVIGNHEFDFYLDALAARVSEADFPYLAANITEETTGELAPFVTPYVVLDVGGVAVGVVGLALDTTYQVVLPPFIEGLWFESSADTLETYVPQARADGAEVIIALAHDSAESLAQTVEEASVQVDLALGGHGHVVDSFMVGDVPVVETGQYFMGFTRIDLTFDRGVGAVVDSTVVHTEVRYPADEDNPVTPDPAVQAVVDAWQQQTDAELGEVVGYSESGFVQRSWKQANWVLDAWLAEHALADVAIVQFGAFRQATDAGEITPADLVGLLPFENYLVTVELTGAQIQALLLHGVTTSAPNTGNYPAVAGMTYLHTGNTVEITLTGAGTFDPGATYTVVTSDYMYYGGNGYDFESYNPNPVMLGDHMRDPVMAWTQALGTSAADPLESYLDSTPRDQ